MLRKRISAFCLRLIFWSSLVRHGHIYGLLAGIAAISLLVGGIGIMNIMFGYGNRRTREIGLRKALGARTETVVLCNFSSQYSDDCGRNIGMILEYIFFDYFGSSFSASCNISHVRFSGSRNIRSIGICLVGIRLKGSGSFSD